MKSEIITASEVAFILKISVRQVYDLAAKDELPCFKINTSVRFFRADVEAWVASLVNNR